MHLVMTEEVNDDLYEFITAALAAVCALSFVVATVLHQRAKRREGVYKANEFVMIAVGADDKAQNKADGGPDEAAMRDVDQDDGETGDNKPEEEGKDVESSRPLRVVRGSHLSLSLSLSLCECVCVCASR